MIEPKNIKKRSSQKLSLTYLNKLCSLNDLSNNKNKKQNQAPFVSLKGIKTFKTNKNSLLSKLDTNVQSKRNNNREYRPSMTQYSLNFDEILSTSIPRTERSSMIDNSYNNVNSLMSSRNYLHKKNNMDFNIDDNQSVDISNSNNNRTFYNQDYEFIYDLPLFYSNKQNNYLKNIRKIQANWKGYLLRNAFYKIKKLNKSINKILNNSRKIVFIFIKNNFFLAKDKKYIIKDNNKKEDIKNTEDIIKKTPINEKNKIDIPYKKFNNTNEKDKVKEEKNEHSEKINISNTNSSTTNSMNNSDSKINKFNSPPVTKFDIRSYLKFPLLIPKIIKKICLLNYFSFFITQLSEIQKLKISQKKTETFIKLFNSNTKKIMKKYFNSYKQKILIYKTAETVYKSIAQSMTYRKIHVSKKLKKKHSFSFKDLYRKDALGNLIKKYDYNSKLIKKYYFLWKKLAPECNNINNNLNINEQINEDEKIEKHQQKKAKRHIKIKFAKKGSSNNLISTLSSISLDENNKNSSSDISNDIIKPLVKKMKVRKVAVNPKYYNYVKNNKNILIDEIKNYKK